MGGHGRREMYCYLYILGGGGYNLCRCLFSPQTLRLLVCILPCSFPELLRDQLLSVIQIATCCLSSCTIFPCYFERVCRNLRTSHPRVDV